MTARPKTVKQVDQKDPYLLDHVGVDLWRPALAWQERLHGEMVNRGHAWYGDARRAIASVLHPQGSSQSELVARLGMTKQAVQQLLDGLEADDIVRREPDPADRRGKRVVYTERGLAAVRDATTIKRSLEHQIRTRLGARSFETLRATLAEVTAAIAAARPPRRRRGARSPCVRDRRRG